MFRRPPLFITITCALVFAFLLGRFTVNPSLRNDPDGSGEISAMAASRNSPASFPEDGGPGAIGGLAAKAFADAAGKPIVDHARLVITEKRSLARSALLESLIERITRDNWLSVFEVEWHAREEGQLAETNLRRSSHLLPNASESRNTMRTTKNIKTTETPIYGESTGNT